MNEPTTCGSAVPSSDLLGRVLVACEYSGSVRDELTALGWDAWSADLLPTETPGKHIQGDVREILNDGWDMMIAHPPCTHLACSGAAWFEKKRADGRQQQGIELFMAFATSPIKRIGTTPATSADATPIWKTSCAPPMA